MRIPRLYHDGELTVNHEVQLTETAARHAIQVLRLEKNSPVILFNGDGCDYPASISQTKKQHVCAVINNVNAVTNESHFHIELGLALIKSDRMDFAIQKSVELGVTAITPLNTDYASIQIKQDKQEKKLQHWQGVIQHACEQCGRASLPVLNPINRLSAWFNTNPATTVVLNPYTQSGVTALALQNSVRLCIGPEGGFSDKEMEYLEQAQQLKLGPRILRAETAAISGITLLQHRFGDFSQPV